MLLSDRSFERGVYTSQIIIVLVFVVASVLALRPEPKLDFNYCQFCDCFNWCSNQYL